jgi:drug/metabolite transporter (DMT)-like permease
MFAIALAIVSALGFGASDYAAGLATRVASVFQVTLVAQLSSLSAALLVVPWVSPFRLSASAAWWGAAAGIAGIFGALALYVGFRHAVFSVASTLSAVGSAALSVLAGLLFGERPSALAFAGIALALPAIAAISASPRAAEDGQPGNGQDGNGQDVTGRHLAGVGYGLAAGAGFALYFIGLNRAGSSDGLWPVIVADSASLPVLVACLMVTRQLGLPARGARLLAVATGATGSAGMMLYFVASHHGLLAVTAVIASLYPGGTIVLARIRPGERLGPVRLAGLALAGASVALIAIAGSG